ncbi:MAG: radical SAM family heme chaperone HemW [Deltaproteobacteria bacterium]|nr:radical SAM family heme chaperone HemW [Deltaproteobacteria bacterium]
MNRATLSIYIHIPFCVHKCPYCSFNSFSFESVLRANGTSAQQDPHDLERAYTEAIIAELEYFANNSAWSRQEVQSIFFGGGTPSIFSASSIELILRAIEQNFQLATNNEITIEANPGTLIEELSLEKLLTFKAMGINRISLGVQSFSEEKLKKLGRIHSAKDARDAILCCKKAGFTNINLDLIFGIQGERLEQWEADITHAVALEPKHISIYGLTIEAGTEFFKRSLAKEKIAANDALVAKMYGLAQVSLRENNFAQYEISNYSKEGFQCKHNLRYWSRDNYLGVGAGAHSFSNETIWQGSKLRKTIPKNTAWGQRWTNHSNPLTYINKINQSATAIKQLETLDKNQAKLEFFLVNLRTKKGICLANYKKLFKSSMLEDQHFAIQKLLSNNLIQQFDNNLALTDKGFLFADSVLEEFANGVA